MEKKLKKELGERLSSIQAELLARKISADDATRRIEKAKAAYEKRLAAVRRHPRRGYRALMTAAVFGALVTIVATVRMFPADAGSLYASYLASLGSLGVIALVQVQEQRRLRARAAACLGGVQADVVMDAPLARFTCEERELTLIATEVKNHQALASVLDDEALAELSGNLLDFLTSRVARHGGTLIPGGHDSFLAVFPKERAREHARTAVECARAMQVELVHASALVAAQGRAAHLGMGISSGRAQLGVVGTQGQQVYVCAGRTAELARELAAAASWGEVLLADELSVRLEGDVKMQAREPLRSLVADAIVRIHAVVIPAEHEGL